MFWVRKWHNVSFTFYKDHFRFWVEEQGSGSSYHGSPWWCWWPGLGRNGGVGEKLEALCPFLLCPSHLCFPCIAPFLSLQGGGWRQQLAILSLTAPHFCRPPALFSPLPYFLLYCFLPIFLSLLFLFHPIPCWFFPFLTLHYFCYIQVL